VTASAPESSPRLFHLVAAPAWREACERGSYAPASLGQEGFIHFSYRSQVAGTANRFYRELDDLIVVEVDPTRFPSPVVVEDSYGAGQAFPHVYAAIPTSAAVAEHPLTRDERGDFVFT
jgi:uncharacterized protein (DUF952 family)